MNTNYVLKVELIICNNSHIFSYFQIPDDDDNSPKMATEASSSADSSPQPGNRTYACSPDKAQLSAAMQSMNVETANGVSLCNY